MRLGHERERGAGRLAGLFDPAGQKTFDLSGGQVGLNRETAVALGGSGDAAGDVDRNCAADRTGRIKPEIGSRRFVEHAGNVDIGGLLAAHPAVFQARRGAADLDVAFQGEALIIRAHFEVRRFDFLSHDHPVGGEVQRVDRDRIIGRTGRQIRLERHCQGDECRHIAARGGRIEWRARRRVAQAVRAQQFGGRRHRAIELEMHPRRRLARRGVRNFKQT